MLDRKQAGKIQTVTLYKRNGNFENQAQAVKSALCEMLPKDCSFYCDDNIAVKGSNATFTFSIKQHKSLTPSQSRHMDLLEEHGHVTYVTELRYVLTEKDGHKRLDFDGTFRKANKPGFDRRALDNLVRIGLVEVTTTQKIFGDYPHDAAEGNGYCINETYRVAEYLR
jgi:hypothetical protein